MSVTVVVADLHNDNRLCVLPTPSDMRLHSEAVPLASSTPEEVLDGLRAPQEPPPSIEHHYSARSLDAVEREALRGSAPEGRFRQVVPLPSRSEQEPEAGHQTEKPL